MPAARHPGLCRSLKAPAGSCSPSAVSAGDRALAGYPFGPGPDMVIHWWRHRDAHWRKKPDLQRQPTLALHISPTEDEA